MTQQDHYYYKIEKKTLKIVAKVVLKTEKIARASILTRDRAAVKALLKTVDKFVNCERNLFDAEEKKLLFGVIFFSTDMEEKKNIIATFKNFLKEILDEEKGKKR